VWVVSGRLTFERVAGAQTVLDGGWLVPGLVDAHCHVGLGPGGAVDLAEARRQALVDRDAGALLLRDAGSPLDTSPLQGEAELPRILRAGRHLARPRRYLPEVAVELEPAQLPAAVAEQARAGDGWVKLVGDWIDRERGDLVPLWAAAELAAAVRAAHDAGARITAHVFGAEAVDGLLDAGFDCIEHATGMTDDQIGRLAAAGTAVVPTLINVENFPGIADRATRFPAYAAHMRRLHEHAPARVRAAYEAGVPIYAGSDAGGGIAHGRIGDEIRALAGAGLPAEAALAAGSWAARSWLGLPGLAEGAPADLVAYPEDPGADLAVLAAPVRVLRAGAVVR